MMENNFEINFNEKKEVWDNFVTTSPQRNIFVTSKFLDSLGAKYDLVTCRKGERVEAGTVVIFENDLPINHTFPFTQYQGIILADNMSLASHSKIPHEFEVLEFFVNALVSKYKSICLVESWRFTDMRPILWQNYHEPERGTFKVDLRYTPILDLTKIASYEEYLGSVRRLIRREIAKAEANLTIETSDDIKMLDDLHDKTFKRQGVERDEEESNLVKNIAKGAIEGGYGRLMCAELDGKPISAFLSLSDDRTCFHIFAANDPDYRDSGAGTALVVDTIKDSLERGLKEIDFVGANSPYRSAYKLSFNSELRPFFVASFLNTTSEG